MAALVCSVRVTSKLQSGYPRDQNAELQLDPKLLLNGCGAVLKHLQCLGTEPKFRTMHLVVAQSDEVQYFTSDDVLELAVEVRGVFHDIFQSFESRVRIFDSV
jgi:hypothetical protein